VRDIVMPLSKTASRWVSPGADADDGTSSSFHAAERGKSAASFPRSLLSSTPLNIRRGAGLVVLLIV